MLISASRDGHLEVVRTLLSKYADVDAVDSVSIMLPVSLGLSLSPFLNPSPPSRTVYVVESLLSKHADVI